MGECGSSAGQAEYHSDPVMTKFIDVATETVFGSLWTRPGLDSEDAHAHLRSSTPRPAAIPS